MLRVLPLGKERERYFTGASSVIKNAISEETTDVLASHRIKLSI